MLHLRNKRDKIKNTILRIGSQLDFGDHLLLGHFPHVGQKLDLALDPESDCDQIALEGF